MSTGGRARGATPALTARAATVVLLLTLAACQPAVDTAARPSGPAIAPSGSNLPATSAPAAAASAEEPGDPLGPAAGRTRFAGRIVDPLPRALVREMRGETWRPGCPVPLSDLALLRFNYRGFDGEIERGPMVVHAAVAQDVLDVFHTLFRAGFPIRDVALAERFRPNADPDSRRSVTASFNCRPVVTPDGPQDTFSQHSYGLAIDINSLQNPYVRADGFVRNRFARPYVDRSQDHPGMIHDGDVVVRAFAAIGWSWGGHWSGGKDYMHFSLADR